MVDNNSPIQQAYGLIQNNRRLNMQQQQIDQQAEQQEFLNTLDIMKVDAKKGIDYFNNTFGAKYGELNYVKPQGKGAVLEHKITGDMFYFDANDPYTEDGQMKFTPFNLPKGSETYTLSKGQKVIKDGKVIAENPDTPSGTGAKNPADFFSDPKAMIHEINTANEQIFKTEQALVSFKNTKDDAFLAMIINAMPDKDADGNPVPKPEISQLTPEDKERFVASVEYRLNGLKNYVSRLENSKGYQAYIDNTQPQTPSPIDEAYNPKPQTPQRITPQNIIQTVPADIQQQIKTRALNEANGNMETAKKLAAKYYQEYKNGRF